MGIEHNINQSAIKRNFDDLKRKLDEKTFEAMSYVGEEAVTHARLIPEEIGFEDQTGNLRSSIGYVLYKDGVLFKDWFRRSPKGRKDGSEGMAAGKAEAIRVAESNPKGWVLVVVAGMEYGETLEREHGRDVINSAERLTITRMPRALKTIEQYLENLSQ